MVGTANPFYAAQVWMLTDNGEATDNGFDFLFEDIFDMVDDIIRKMYKILFNLFARILTE